MIDIYRVISDEKVTIGDLYFDNKFLCNTLEDPVRCGDDLILTADEKIFGETAIPTGCYEVGMGDFQNRGTLLPKLLNVPLFSGIYFHNGNTVEDTKGCILVGMYDPKHPNMITTSLDTLHKSFIPRVLAALAKGTLLCTITGGARES